MVGGRKVVQIGKDKVTLVLDPVTGCWYSDKSQIAAVQERAASRLRGDGDWNQGFKRGGSEPAARQPEVPVERIERRLHSYKAPRRRR